MLPTRRTFLKAGTGSLALLTLPPTVVNALAQATPEAEALPPEQLFTALAETEVTTPLLPSDGGPYAIVPWEDDKDDDLTGTIGGLLMSDTSKGDTDAAFIGAYIVHPTVESAEARFNEVMHDPEAPDQDPMFFSFPGATSISDDGYGFVSLRIGPLLISAVAQSTARRGPDDPVEIDALALAARASAHLAGMLDHYRMVSSAMAS